MILRLLFIIVQCPNIQHHDFIIAKACSQLNVNISLRNEMHSNEKRGKNKLNDIPLE